MKKYFQQMNKFWLKIVIITTVFCCSFFYYKQIDSFQGLRFLAYFLLAIDVFLSGVRNLARKRKRGDFIVLFLSVVLGFMDSFSDAFFFLLIFQIIEYWKFFKEDQERFVLIRKNGCLMQEKITKIRRNMVYYLKKDSIVPTSGIVDTKGAVFLLENKKISTKKGDKIASGAKFLGENVEIRSLENYKDSQFTKNQKQISLLFEKLPTKEKTAALYRMKICFILGLFFIFIPNLIFGTFQPFMMRIGVFLVLSGILSFLPENLIFLKEQVVQNSFYKKITIHNFKAFQKLSRVKTVFLEKTGILTTGEFRITEVHTTDEKQLLEALTYVSYFSKYPLKRVLSNYQKISVQEKKIKDFCEVSGRGAECRVGQDHIVAGNYYYLKEKGIDVEVDFSVGTIIYVAVNHTCIGSIVVSDSIKCNVRNVVDSIKKKGVSQVIVLSGDNERINRAICQELGILDQYSNLTPFEKEFWMMHIQEQTSGASLFLGHSASPKELFPLADVSICFSNSLTLERGDIVLPDDSMSLVPLVFDASRNYKKEKLQIIGVFILLKILWWVLVLFSNLPLYIPLLGEGVIGLFFQKRIHRKWGL